MLLVIPGDHEPRHVHARHGTTNPPEAVFELGSDGKIALREADRELTRAQIRDAHDLVAKHFNKLEELWETYC